MKKTMLTLMATVGLAFGAKAVLPTTTGFETGYDLGPLNLANLTQKYEWSAATTNGLEATDLACVVTNYADAASKPTNLPDAFSGAGDNYLAVDTSGAILYRNVNDRTTDTTTAFGAPESIGSGLFFDSDVQFTATDSTGTPEATAGDKLIVWLSGDDEGNTNLIVTASIGHSLGESLGTSNYTNTNPKILVKDNEWHRLTVAAATEDTVTTFKVYVDGEQVTADGVAENKFYSLVAGNYNNYNTLTAVGFMGTGAIDNLVWTTEDPFYVEPPTTVALTVELTDENFAFTELAANAEAVDVAAPAPIVADVNDVITFVAKVADGYTPTVAGYVLQKSAEKDEDDCYAYTFTVTVKQAMIDDGLTLTINVTADDSGDDPAQVVPGTPAEVEAESAEAAVAKAEKVIPEAVKTAVGAGGETYLSYFELVATKTETPGTYNVEMKLTTAAKASLEEDADDGVEDLLDAVNALTGEETKASANVTVPAGFYWALSSGTTLEGMANDAGNTPSAGTVNLSVTKETDDTAGFYQLLISPTPIPSTKE